MIEKFLFRKVCESMNKLAKLMITIALFLPLLEITAQASELNFSVIPIIPETQFNKNKSYFDLKLGAGQIQDLEVTLKNSTDKSISVETTLNRATTNLNGVVEYGKTNTEKDSSMVNNIEDYVQIREQEVLLNPNEERTIKLKVTAPKEEFEGVMVGGLTFKEKIGAMEKEKKNDTLTIENEYAYVVGVVLHGNLDVAKPQLALNEVEASQVNARNVINANLQNKTSTYINKMEINAKITKKGSKNLLYSVEKKDMQMAPNSNFNFPISLQGKRLEQGIYTLEMEVTSLTETWEFRKDFAITKEAADKYNKMDVSIEKEDTYRYLWILIGILFITTGIVYLIYLNRKNENKYKKELEELKKRS